MNYCLDLAWEEVLKEEDQGDQLNREAYENLSNRSKHDRWVNYLMDPGVSSELKWKAEKGASSLFYKTGTAITGVA